MHNRDNRPLQNSMFLPERPNVMKRSSMDYNLPLPNNMSNTHTPSYNAEHPKQINNLVSSPHSRPQHFQSFYQDNPRSPKHSTPNLSANLLGTKNVDQAIHEITQKLQKLSKKVDRHETKLESLGETESSSEMSKKILNEVRQNLPLITGSNDVYEHLFNVKLDIKAINEEIQRMPKFKDLEQISQSTGSSKRNSISSQSQSENEYISQQALKKRDEYLQKIFSTMENQINNLKKNFSLMKTQMKVSPISSSSCIMLKYQQLFKARNKNQSDTVINEQTYYIDNEGFLLDCHSRYLVDQKGKKVRLEDRHLTMLRNQRILQ